MASNYSKLDLKGFKERLGAKHYANATGARRGVGKSEMSEADKASAYAAINKHFNVEAAPKASAPKAKRTPAKKTAAVKTPATKARGTGRAKRTAAKKTTSAKGRKGADAEGAPAAQELADLLAGADATRQALAGLGEAADIDGSIDVKTAARRGADILQRSIERISQILEPRLPAVPEPVAPPSSPTPVAPAPAPEDEEEEDDDEDTTA